MTESKDSFVGNVFQVVFLLTIGIFLFLGTSYMIDTLKEECVKANKTNCSEYDGQHIYALLFISIIIAIMIILRLKISKDHDKLRPLLDKSGWLCVLCRDKIESISFATTVSKDDLRTCHNLCLYNQKHGKPVGFLPKDKLHDTE